MLRYGLLLAVLPILAAAQSCNIGAGRTQPCFQHMLVVVDNTAYVRTASRATGLFNYIQTLLSAYDFSSQSAYVSMGYYGLSDPSESWSPVFLGFGQTDPATMCNVFNELQQYEVGDNLGSTKITDALLALYNVTANSEPTPYDSIVLFTASTDQSDIVSASHVLGVFNANFTVVNLAGADFSSWTGAKVLCQDYPFPAGYAQTITGQQCGASGSNTCGMQLSTVSPPQPPTVLPSSGPSTNCPCTVSKSWNDIFFVFDGSNALKPNNFAELVTFFFSAGGQLNIGQAQKSQSRVGIINYGDSATLIAGLDKYTQTADLYSDIDNVVRNNKEGTNILGAIDIARDAFQGSTHRKASRKVIVIGASTYRDGAYDSPITQANTFKDNGGVIIVVAYGDLHGNIAHELQQIASPGYYIDATSQSPPVAQLTALLCSANCFCPSVYSASSSSVRGEPTDGCFQTSNLQSVDFLAKRYCAQQHAGLLAAVPTAAQKVFITKNTQPNNPIYVGLERSSNGQWTWSDGTPFFDSINDNGGDCATVTRTNGFNTRLDSVQCSSAELYACQATPCSTDVYCSV